jgi:hypothetical protein
MIWVTEANYEGGYKLWVRFNDGRCGIIDLGPWLAEEQGPVFGPLRDLDEFRCFRVDMDTIVWGNGADLAPEFLYDMLDDGAKRANGSE